MKPVVYIRAFLTEILLYLSLPPFLVDISLLRPWTLDSTGAHCDNEDVGHKHGRVRSMHHSGDGTKPAGSMWCKEKHRFHDLEQH